MGAAGLHSEVGVVVELHGAPFGIALFLLVELDVDNIARYDKRHKNHQSVDLGHGHALGASVANRDVFQQWQFSVSSSHDDSVFEVYK